MKTGISIDENIYSISMKIENQRISWSLNDGKVFFDCGMERLEGGRNYAFASLRREAEFEVIDF